MRKLNMDELNRKTPEECRLADRFPIAVVLENIRSAYNVGSVFRTADAFLVDSVYITGYTATPPHKEIRKTALGAEESVDWYYFKTTAEAIAKLKQDGFKVYAVEQVENSLALNHPGLNFDEKTAFVFGNEVTGVDDSTLALCEGSIEIPQFGMKHSLNISVAAGVVLWEVVRSASVQQNP